MVCDDTGGSLGVKIFRLLHCQLGIDVEVVWWFLGFIILLGVATLLYRIIAGGASTYRAFKIDKGATLKSISTQFRALLIFLFFISLLFMLGYIRQLVVNDAPILGLILRVVISVSLVMASRWLTDFIDDREHFATGWKKIF